MSLRALVLASLLPASQAFAAPYDDAVNSLKRLVADAPDYVTLIDIGTNDQGVAIQAVRIEAPTPFPESRPTHLVVGAHHGNELLSVDVALATAEQLVEALQDPFAADHDKLVQNAYVVIPVLNIGGYNSSRREERSRAGVSLDPNRDYPDPCTTDTPFVLASTTNLATFVNRENIIAAVTIHGYIGTFTYPWGIYTDQSHTQDDQVFIDMARQSVAISGYDTGTHKDAIYPTAGAFEDWAYFEHGVWVMLLEIANRPNIEKDARSLLKYLAIAPKARSNHHEHLGECTNMPETIRARP